MLDEGGPVVILYVHIYTVAFVKAINKALHQGFLKEQSCQRAGRHVLLWSESRLKGKKQSVALNESAMGSSGVWYSDQIIQYLYQ